MCKVGAVTYQISRVQIRVQISEKISPAGGREQLVQIYFYFVSPKETSVPRRLDKET
jgi:hypothetical protein